jgi:hypothetical protein
MIIKKLKIQYLEMKKIKLMNYIVILILIMIIIIMNFIVKLMMKKKMRKKSKLILLMNLLYIRLLSKIKYQIILIIKIILQKNSMNFLMKKNFFNII